MTSAPDLDDSDSELDYDLSLEDEKLLASLADNAQAQAQAQPYHHATGPIPPAPQTLGTLRTTRESHHVASTPRSSQGGEASLVGVARSNSVDAFVCWTKPQSMPSGIPADDVQYPDRRWLFPCEHHQYAQDNPD